MEHAIAGAWLNLNHWLAPANSMVEPALRA